MDYIVDKFVKSILSEIRIIESKVICAIMSNERDKVEVLQMDKLNRQRVARIISIPESEWHLHGEVFDDFDLLSNYLAESDLEPEERAQLVLYFIRKNIACGLLEEGMAAYDAPKMHEYKFKYITPEECKELIETEKFYELKNREIITLSEREKQQLEDVEGFIDANPLDISEIINKHKIIQQCYFDKEPNLTKDDFKKLIMALYALNFSSTAVRCVKFYLGKTCNIINEDKEEKDKKIAPVVLNTEPKKEVLSKKEYYVLEQELKKYFDIDNMEAIRILSFDEEIYCIYLMNKMQYSKDIMNNVIKIIKKARKIGKINPIEHYLYMVDKIQYYIKLEGMRGKYLELDKYFNKLFMIPTEDDMVGPDEYDIYKEYMRLILDEVVDLMPDSFDYEYEEADKYGLKLTR